MKDFTQYSLYRYRKLIKTAHVHVAGAGTEENVGFVDHIINVVIIFQIICTYSVYLFIPKTMQH